MLNRRAFLYGTTATVLAAPLTASAQRRQPLRRIGVVCTVGCGPTGGGLYSGGGFSFTVELASLGYDDGKDIVVDMRGAGVTEGGLQRVVEDLLRRNTDVIVAAGSSSAVWAAKRATTRTPIVMAISEDAVDTGLVASLARPGGNITGVSAPYPDLIVKQLEIVREMASGASRVGVLAMSGNASHEAAIRRLRAVAGHRIQLHVERASAAEHNLATSLSRLGEARVDALLIMPHPLLFGGGQVAMFGLQLRIPTVSTFSEFASAAGLIAYGPSASDLLARAARYVDRILKGASTADLPVEQPTTFQSVINATTAKAINAATAQEAARQ